MKSSLNLPLKFLILLSSSCLPKAAIEVASFSKYFFDTIHVILVAVEKSVNVSRIHVVCIVYENHVLLLEDQHRWTNVKIARL